MSAPERLARGLVEAGFVDIQHREVSRTHRFPNRTLATLVRGHLTIHHRSLLRYCSPQLVDQMVEQVATGLAGISEDGQIEVRELELLFVATKP